MYMNLKEGPLDRGQVSTRALPCRQAVALVLAAAFVPQANAQEAATPALGEVVVTARRYEENLQKVPVAVEVMDARYLEAQHISTAKEIIDLSPGTNFTQFNKLQHAYSMRGLS